MKKFGLVLKIEDDLKDYLSCEIKFSGDIKQAWPGQPNMISNLEKKFGDQEDTRNTRAKYGQKRGR